MKHGIRYIVTKGSDDGTFAVGDKVWLLDNGDLMCKPSLGDLGGWIQKSTIKKCIQGMEYEVDAEWAARRKAKLLAELEGVK